MSRRTIVAGTMGTAAGRRAIAPEQPAIANNPQNTIAPIQAIAIGSGIRFSISILLSTLDCELAQTWERRCVHTIASDETAKKQRCTDALPSLALNQAKWPCFRLRQ